MDTGDAAVRSRGRDTGVAGGEHENAPRLSATDLGTGRGGAGRDRALHVDGDRGRDRPVAHRGTSAEERGARPGEHRTFQHWGGLLFFFGRPFPLTPAVL